jgi:hypothetical protein
MVVTANGGQCKAEGMQEETSGVGSTLQLLWPYMHWNSTWARKTQKAVLLDTGRRTEGSRMPEMLAISKYTQIEEHQKLDVNQTQEFSQDVQYRTGDRSRDANSRARYGPLFSDPSIGDSCGLSVLDSAIAWIFLTPESEA